MSYSCILDQRVHRTLFFETNLAKPGAPVTITLKKSPDPTDPDTSYLQIVFPQKSVMISAPAITTLQKRAYVIDTPGEGQFSMYFSDETGVRIFLTSTQLSSDANYSVLLLHMKDPASGKYADFFVITDKTAAAAPTFVPAGSGVKIPPNVGVKILDEYTESLRQRGVVLQDL